MIDSELSIYMDCYYLNRPTDDQIQDKIHIESDAIIGILFKCFYDSWKLIGSDIVEYEIMQTPLQLIWRETKVLVKAR
jgi:hypothetical protein